MTGLGPTVEGSLLIIAYLMLLLHRAEMRLYPGGERRLDKFLEMCYILLFIFASSALIAELVL